MSLPTASPSNLCSSLSSQLTSKLSDMKTQWRHPSSCWKTCPPPPLPELENVGWRLAKEGGSGFPLNGFFSGAEMTIGLQRDIEFPKRFELTPAMKCFLKRNVAMFADGFRVNPKKVQPQASGFPGTSTVSKLGSSSSSGTAAVLGWQPGDSHNLNDQEDLNSVTSKFLDLNIDDNVEFVPEDDKEEVIVTLVDQIKDLEKQLKERKDWAHEKALQAAKKLSGDLIELKKFKMEREENKKPQKETEALRSLTTQP